MKHLRTLHKITAWAALVGCLPLLLPAQSTPATEAGWGYAPMPAPAPDTVFVHDTAYVFISNLNDITEKLGMSYDRYVQGFLLYLSHRDSAHRYSPEGVYLNYFMPMLQAAPNFSEKRWIRGIFSLYASPDATFMRYNPAPAPGALARLNRNADVMFECRGEMNTDFFLQSPGLISVYLVELFKYIHQVNSAKRGEICGVNFYFPDFSFNKKRAMAQFAKSAALVVDCSRLETINRLRLYFSFGERGAAEREYLSCIADMADSIFVFGNSNPDRLFAETMVITREAANDYWLLSKVKEQLYLATFSYPDVLPYSSPYEFNDADTITLINSDYPENNWETYAAVVLIIFLLFLLGFILYWTIPALSYYLNRSREYLIILLLMLAFEVVLLLFSMVEAMSRSSVFDFSHNDKGIVFLMPALLIFIIPLLKMAYSKKNAP
jgi:hypothetical protein